MIDKFEITKRNGSSCYKCHKPIKKEQIRGIEYANYRGHLTYHYYCEKCSKKMLEDTRKMLNRFENRLIAYSKKLK